MDARLARRITLSPKRGNAGRNFARKIVCKNCKNLVERKDLTSYINIGTPIKPLQGQFGTDSRIQLNDTFKTTAEIRDFIAAERDAMSEADRSFMTVAIKADENTRMGIVTDVKQELRKCSALKIMYTARKGE